MCLHLLGPQVLVITPVDRNHAVQNYAEMNGSMPSPEPITKEASKTLNICVTNCFCFFVFTLAKTIYYKLLFFYLVIIFLSHPSMAKQTRGGGVILKREDFYTTKIH